MSDTINNMKNEMKEVLGNCQICLNNILNDYMIEHPNLPVREEFSNYLLNYYKYNSSKIKKTIKRK